MRFQASYFAVVLLGFCGWLETWRGIDKVSLYDKVGESFRQKKVSILGSFGSSCVCLGNIGRGPCVRGEILGNSSGPSFWARANRKAPNKGPVQGSWYLNYEANNYGSTQIEVRFPISQDLQKKDMPSSHSGIVNSESGCRTNCHPSRRNTVAVCVIRNLRVAQVNVSYAPSRPITMLMYPNGELSGIVTLPSSPIRALLSFPSWLPTI